MSPATSPNRRLRVSGATRLVRIILVTAGAGAGAVVGGLAQPQDPANTSGSADSGGVASRQHPSCVTVQLGQPGESALRTPGGGLVVARPPATWMERIWATTDALGWTPFSYYVPCHEVDEARQGQLDQCGGFIRVDRQQFRDALDRALGIDGRTVDVK